MYSPHGSETVPPRDFQLAMCQPADAGADGAEMPPVYIQQQEGNPVILPPDFSQLDSDTQQRVNALLQAAGSWSFFLNESCYNGGFITFI